MLRRWCAAVSGRGATGALRSFAGVRLSNVPYSLDTEDKLLTALEPFNVKPTSVTLRLRSSGRYSGSADVEFDDATEARAAIKALRRQDLGNGLPIHARDLGGGEKAAVVYAAAIAAQAHEDPLASIIEPLEERRMPTLEEVRRDLLDYDQHDLLRGLRLPGLMKPEWENDEPMRQPQDKGDKLKSPVLGRWAETIVKVDRVQKVAKGGTIMKYRALVVIGNLMGAGGFAYGKGITPQDAVARAIHKAKSNLFFVDRYKGTALTHDVRGKHNNCIVDIIATPPGYGQTGGKLGRQILTQLGFSSFTIKGRGRRSPASYVRATFEALENHMSVEQIARKRGRRILEIENALHTGPRYTP